MCACAIGTRHCVREMTAATYGVSKDPLLAGGCCVQMHLTLQLALFLVSLFLCVEGQQFGGRELAGECVVSAFLCLSAYVCDGVV